MSLALYPCSNGHLSADPEYCSECGKKLSSVPENIPNPSTPNGSAPPDGGALCPDCGTPRATPTAMFCEVCRYNFVSRQSWTPDAPVTAASASPVPSVAPVPPTVSPVPDGMLRRWEAVVVVDPTLYADPDPAKPVPTNTPERVFPLDFPENLIGRRSERRAIYPEIDLSGDSGVSSRHAILYREADGGLSLLDVGSTNGTQINGTEVVPGIRMPLTEGEQITVGCWSRITVRSAGGKT